MVIISPKYEEKYLKQQDEMKSNKNQSKIFQESESEHHHMRTNKNTKEGT